MNNILERHQRWHILKCDGGWEHTDGVKVGNIDNLGWTLAVDLAHSLRRH